MRRDRISTVNLFLLSFCLYSLISVRETVGFPSSVDQSYGVLNMTDMFRSANLPALCNGTCVINLTDCSLEPNTCYIEGLCYDANQTRLSDFSCLQCRPEMSTTSWSFNPDCFAAEICSNERLRLFHTCLPAVIFAFYNNSKEAENSLYNFEQCSRDRSQCQAGFFLQLPGRPAACCPGYFCPEGQTCMIPCRQGTYCPSPLPGSNGTCRSEVRCPEPPIYEYGMFGCGGSKTEGFCPAGSFCRNPTVIERCPNNTKYCPTGVNQALDCPSGFVCWEGRARRTRIITQIIVSVLVIIVSLVIISNVSQWLVLTKKLFGQHRLVDPPGVSNYFRKATQSRKTKKYLELHIHLDRAKLRNVTRFDPIRNEGFTGRIQAGKLTALMGGSGCGKSSLLETIHGRRRLRPNGSITFAQYEPLSNILTDYVGYVPQADIMHNDLTVFETVYYSARTRRLNESKEVIINDVCFVLEQLGLEIMHNSFTKTLSGGQRKRVNVAMEVAACPKVLLLDEPTSGLDTFSCDNLFELLQLIKFSQAGPVTIIMVIHQPSHELFEKIDEIFFLTPLCCLAYQGPRQRAQDVLKQKIFHKTPHECPPPRHNDCDTCFIMLTKAKNHLDNHRIEDETTVQLLQATPLRSRMWFPFYYILLRSIRQIYLRGIVAEAAYMLAYFLLGACLGYLFENKQQGTCDISVLPTIYFLISLAFGILTCISSQRLFGVETTDQTYERESRNYFHPFQYWLAKSLVDIVRMILYPLLFISMLYVEVVPRGEFSYYVGIMILLSFICSGIGQLTSVIFDRTEYAYLAGTIVALLSCLLSGFSPTRAELGRGDFILTISFSRHVQNLFFRHETDLYVNGGNFTTHIWAGPAIGLRAYYGFEDRENPYFWLIFLGFVLRILTFFFLYGKSEYRSKTRFYVTNAWPSILSLIKCEDCKKNSSKEQHLIDSKNDPYEGIDDNDTF